MVTTTSQQPHDLDGSSDTDACPVCKWLPRDVPNLQDFLEPFHFGMINHHYGTCRLTLEELRAWRRIPRSQGKCQQATPTQRSPCMVMKQRSGQLLIKYLTNERQIIKLSKACTAQDSLLLNAVAMVARDLDRSELSKKHQEQGKLQSVTNVSQAKVLTTTPHTSSRACRWKRSKVLRGPCQWDWQCLPEGLA